MDYTQILASQFVRQSTSGDDEDAFYDALSFERFAKLRRVFQKIVGCFNQSERAASAAISQTTPV